MSLALPFMIIFVPVSVLALGATIHLPVTLRTSRWMFDTNIDLTKSTYTTEMQSAKRSVTHNITIPTFLARTTDHIIDVTRSPAVFTYAPFRFGPRFHDGSVFVSYVVNRRRLHTQRVTASRKQRGICSARVVFEQKKSKPKGVVPQLFRHQTRQDLVVVAHRQCTVKTNCIFVPCSVKVAIPSY